MMVLPLTSDISNVLIGISVVVVLVCLVFAYRLLLSNDKNSRSTEITTNLHESTYISANSQETSEIPPSKITQAALINPPISQIPSDLLKANSFGHEQYVFDDLKIDPLSAYRSQNINISCKVTNFGKLPVSINVQLRLNGQLESSQNIAISPGNSRLVAFSGSEDIIGVYYVQIANLEGSFTVT